MLLSKIGLSLKPNNHVKHVHFGHVVYSVEAKNYFERKWTLKRLVKLAFSTVLVWQYGKQWPSCLSEYWRKAQESRKWEGRVIIRDVNQIPSYWGLLAGLCWDQMWVTFLIPNLFPTTTCFFAWGAITVTMYTLADRISLHFRKAYLAYFKPQTNKERT